MMLAELWWRVRYSARATSLLHVLAMWAPFNSWRIFFYRLRGTKIGRDVYIAQGCFFEESRPWLITIEDGVKIGPFNHLLTHDAVLYPETPYRYEPIVLKRDCRLGACNVVLPGVTIGERAALGAGCVIRKDVPADMVAVGSNETRLLDLGEVLARAEKRRESDVAKDAATKYPWRLDT